MLQQPVKTLDSLIQYPIIIPNNHDGIHHHAPRKHATGGIAFAFEKLESPGQLEPGLCRICCQQAVTAPIAEPGSALPEWRRQGLQPLEKGLRATLS